jgi:hypothetical protein
MTCGAFCPPTVPEAQQPPTPDTTGRAANGRFAKGNGGGPGNPFARQVAEWRRSALAATTPENIAAVIEQLHKQALQGDVAAAKLYLAYTLGKPAPSVDPDTLDVQEAVQLQREVSLIQVVTHAVVKPLLAALLGVVRVSRPEATQKLIAELLAGLAAQDEAERAAAAAAEAAPPAADQGADSTCQDETSSPSPNGAIGAEPPGAADSRPPDAPAAAWPDRRPQELPTADATNGGPDYPTPPQAPDPTSARSRRPGRWVPPWEDPGGPGLPS